MDRDLNIGVIGVSSRGTLALHAQKPGKGSKIIAGADPYPEVLKEWEEKMQTEYNQPVKSYGDYRDLLKNDEVDAVFICSPDFCHEEQAVAALEAGKAVYLEKPMAITIEGCDRILQKAKETGTKLYLGHNMRHFESVLKMKEVIDSGMIGEVKAAWCRHFVAYGGDAYFKDWHSERKYSTGLLLQKGAHDIDVIHWLTGGYSKTVAGMGNLSVYDKCERREPGDNKRPDNWWDANNWPPLSQTGMSQKIDVEDHNMVFMQMDNGVQASYLQCHYTPDSERNYTFIGTKGRVENLGDSGDCKVVVFTGRSDGRREPDVVYNLKGSEGGHGGADPQIVKRFVDFVRDGVAPNTSPVAARNAVAAGVKATESLRNGSMPQQVPELDTDLVAYFENGQN